MEQMLRVGDQHGTELQLEQQEYTVAPSYFYHLFIYIEFTSDRIFGAKRIM